MSGMYDFVGKAEASTEPIGEKLISFFERYNYVVPNYDDPSYRSINSIWYEDSKGIHKTAIVHPIVIIEEERIILNPILSECMQKFETPPSSPRTSIFQLNKTGESKRETPSGNLIRQGPIAFLIATQKGHSTLIVTCGNMVFGIGAIMSEPIECLVVEPTVMEKFAARVNPSVKLTTEEFAVDVVSPDPLFNLFTTKRSSSGISYAAGKVVALLPFRRKNSQNLLDFLNQTYHPDEMRWETEEKTDSHTGEIYEIEIHTNVKYMTTSSPFRGTANIMNCANFLELIFAGIISGSAYGGLVSIPDTIRVTKGPVYSLFGLDSESQPETIFSPVSSPRSSSRSPRSPSGSQERSRSRSRSRERDFTPEEIEKRRRRERADARYNKHVKEGDFEKNKDEYDREINRRGDGWGINKTKKEIKTIKKRKRKTRKEREKKRRRTTRRRKPRRSSTN